MTIRKILVAHDFSEAADRALRFAADLARQTGAQLELAYVHPELSDGQGDLSVLLPPDLPDGEARYVHFLQQELEGVARKVADQVPGPIPCHVVRGDPVLRLEALVEQVGADSVCLGVTGKGAVQQVLLGSVSQLMLRRSTVPVLLVP